MPRAARARAPAPPSAETPGPVSEPRNETDEASVSAASQSGRMGGLRARGGRGATAVAEAPSSSSSASSEASRKANSPAAAPQTSARAPSVQRQSAEAVTKQPLRQETLALSSRNTRSMTPSRCGARAVGAARRLWGAGAYAAAVGASVGRGRLLCDQPPPQNRNTQRRKHSTSRGGSLVGWHIHASQQAARTRSSRRLLRGRRAPAQAAAARHHRRRHSAPVCSLAPGEVRKVSTRTWMERGGARGRSGPARAPPPSSSPPRISPPQQPPDRRQGEITAQRPHPHPATGCPTRRARCPAACAARPLRAGAAAARAAARAAATRTGWVCLAD